MHIPEHVVADAVGVRGFRIRARDGLAEFGEALQDLVDAGYFRELPIDPITGQRDSWVTEFSTTVASPDQTDSGIVDVRSGSGNISSEGTAYNTW